MDRCVRLLICDEHRQAELVEWQRVITLTAETGRPLHEFIGSGQILEVNTQKLLSVHRQKKCATCGQETLDESNQGWCCN